MSGNGLEDGLSQDNAIKLPVIQKAPINSQPITAVLRIGLARRATIHCWLFQWPCRRLAPLPWWTCFSPPRGPGAEKRELVLCKAWCLMLMALVTVQCKELRVSICCGLHDSLQGKSMTIAEDSQSDRQSKMPAWCPPGSMPVCWHSPCAPEGLPGHLSAAQRPLENATAASRPTNDEGSQQKCYRPHEVLKAAHLWLWDSASRICGWRGSLWDVLLASWSNYFCFFVTIICYKVVLGHQNIHQKSKWSSIGHWDWISRSVRLQQNIADSTDEESAFATIRRNLPGIADG